MSVYIVDYGYHGEVVDELADYVDSVAVEDADTILVIGGDGSMLRAIDELRVLGKPFFGINRGTRGFLLNNLDDLSGIEEAMASVKTERLWQLEGTVVFEDGSSEVFEAFNDIWVERASGQSLKARIWINDFEDPSPLMSGDGILFSTPQGSTGYNRSANGKVVPLNVDALQVTPLHMMVNKVKTTSMLFNFDYGFRITMDERLKRPARVFFDQTCVGDKGVAELLVKRSASTVGLQMVSCNSFIEKTLDWQLHR